MTLDRKIIQFLLRLGLWAAIFFMMAGVLINIRTDRMQFQGLSIDQIFSGELLLGDQLLGVGILLLASTPALRVVALMLLWIHEKDWPFVGISITVILTLLLSMLLG